MASIKTAHLKLPASTEDLRALEIGTVVYLTGRIFTAREGVYKRAIEDGAGMPASKAELGAINFHCSPAAAVNAEGGMTSEVYRTHFVPNHAIYLTTVGYGTGALLGRGIKRVANVYWLQELGLAQAVWVLDVENFGPFLVESDLAGASLFERENAKIDAGLAKLYEGTRSPTMRRLGDADDKTQEVI